MRVRGRALAGVALAMVVALGMTGAEACAQAAKPVVAAKTAPAAKAKEPPMTTEQREEYRTKLLEILPPDPPFDAWLKKTNALPPDFNSLPRHNTLPDPLTFLDGRKVTSAAQWPARRAEISSLQQKYVWGKVPPRPKIDHVTVLDERHEPGYLVRNVRLEFGPGDKGTMRVRVYIPDGKGPFPVLINSSLEGWAPSLIRRGYISAGFAGNDSMDDAAALSDLYPDYDFALLPRRGWAAGLVVDYLATLQQVDMKHIAIFGYSRDGKMATLAGALDPRISAVIAGSTGLGGVLSWRSAGERGFGEGIETTTRSFPTWFAPQLRFFAGREDRLPVDGNLLAAMIAPRSLLMEWGNNDQVSNTWGNEQTYYSALKVYKLLGVPDHVATLRVPGFHGANDEEADLDWLDEQFGRSTKKWTNNLIFEWDWNTWRNETHTSLDVTKFPRHTADDLLKTADGGTISTVAGWEKKEAQTREAVENMLGTEPPELTAEDMEIRRFGGGPRRPGAPAAPPRRFGPPMGVGGPAPSPGQVTPNLPLWVISNGGNSYGWLEPEKDETDVKHVTFRGLQGDLYFPKGTPPGKKLPGVVWLHGFSYPLGYMWVYHSDLHPILALVHAGYAVLAYDQSGFGSRLSETGNFYNRYPRWSHMGRLVEDAHAAVDELEGDDMVDPDHVYLYGYSMGGTVALYEAAMDPRVKGVVSISGFTPMRTDPVSRGDGGVARYSEVRDLIPKLGFFIGHESQIPYDFDDLLGMIAPRPVLIVQPQLDRDATPADVEDAVKQAKEVYALYGASGKLTLDEPWDYNRLPNKTLDSTMDWLKANPQ
ncbi:MAG TPA: alpha/beta fold hydrolase [Acidobacteriaceae bacterium]|nr:alpha/beta fold hydrolase [Acidobacteriaceae bacterium]